LKNSWRGRDIDAHEKVFRINMAPLKEYKDHVGQKLDIGWGAPTNVKSCWYWYEKEGQPYEVFGQTLFSDQYQKAIFDCPQMGKDFRKVYTLSYLWLNLAQDILKEYHQGAGTKYRSTGLMAFMAAITVCDQVSMYGFGSHPDGYHHYWAKARNGKEWTGHDYNAEQEFYHDVVKGQGKYMKLLSQFDICKNVTIVDDQYGKRKLQSRGTPSTSPPPKANSPTKPKARTSGKTMNGASNGGVPVGWFSKFAAACMFVHLLGSR